ncbi:MAG TPA: DUF937 domain-containing protein [Puia sp.]|nr:DUF937 domain-containing protein [Puia sp.]
MAFNLLDSVKGLFTSDLISKVSSSLGEGEGGVNRAITGIVPSVLGGIVSKATADSDGASSILNMAKGAAGTGILGSLGNMFTEGGSSGLLSSGSEMVKRLLGSKLGSIASAISSFSGIKESSVSSLMAMVAPAALGILGKHATENNLTSSSLSNMLSSQKASVAAALPAGLGSLAGLTGLTSAGSAIHTAGQEGNSKRWVLPILFAVLIIGLIWLIARGCNKDATTSVPMTDTTTANTTMPVSTEAVSIKVKLPDGTELDAYKGGIEDQLVTYLNSTDPADSISNSRWFDFDNLNFKTGSSDLTDESMKQVQNIASILKAYPKVSIKIGGYTDKTGTEDENMKLSRQRAEAVVTALKKTGSPDGKIAGADGYGSQFAKAAKDAPDEERKKDRRIAVSVRSK